MEHVNAIPRRVSCNDHHPLVGPKPDHVLERDFFIGLHSAIATSALNDLEVDKVDVNRVTPTTAFVDKLPNFNGAALRLGKHARLDAVRPDMAVDVPHGAIALKDERVVDSRLLGWVRDATKGARYHTVARGAGDGILLTDAKF